MRVVLGFKTKDYKNIVLLDDFHEFPCSYIKNMYLKKKKSFLKEIHQDPYMAYKRHRFKACILFLKGLSRHYRCCMLRFDFAFKVLFISM